MARLTDLTGASFSLCQCPVPAQNVRGTLAEPPVASRESRTTRLRESLQALGEEVGGEAGARASLPAGDAL
jgi:hypothetical protein